MGGSNRPGAYPPVGSARSVPAASLPADCDVLVVGGGITGTATAYYLSLAGQSVVLVEQHELNTEASGRNAGSLHGQIQFEPFRTRGQQWARDFLPALRFLADSVAIWRGLAEELDADLEVSTKGGLLVAETEAQAEQIAAKVSLEAAHGFPAEMVTGPALRQLAPYLSDRIVAAEFSTVEGKTNPLLAAPALARAAIRHGARVITNVAVLDVHAEDGGGFRVRTSAGEIRSARLVLGTNGSLATLAATVGVSVSITDEPVQVHATEAVAPRIPHLVYYAGGALTLKQAKAGTVLIGGGWPAGVDADGRPTVSVASMRGNLAVAQRVAPWLASVRLIRAWVGVGNATPDLLPIIGESPSAPGAFVAMFPHMGLTAGPLLGQVLTALVLGRDPGRDLTPFAPSRFA